ncbi:transglycosylase SLT domain-containing protein [Candidatus Woesearchaeota archaeon]|nr:transglycosylase SLT domain-containing protein [Candidatus Woesearchaeota archaeon]
MNKRDLALLAALVVGGLSVPVVSTLFPPKNKPLEQTVSQSVPRDVKKEEPALWNAYALKDYPEYNALLPAVQAESERTGVPMEYLALIALTESAGRGGTRHEPKFQSKYVEPNFERFADLHKSVSARSFVTVSDFKRQLASSTGPFQIMYLTAVELGFSGSFEELSDPKVNAHWAAEYLLRKGVDAKTSLESALRVYNTGSFSGKPHQGYLDRARAYREMFSDEYKKLFPVNR